MSRPGGFLGVACAGSWDPRRTNYVHPEALLPLPVAVPVHAGHRNFGRVPVGVGALWAVDGVGIVLDAVLSSRAHKAWGRVERGEVSLSLMREYMDWDERDGKLYSRGGLIVAVDLVGRPRDPKAVIHSFTPYASMTEAQRETQERLDAYVTDERQPRADAFVIDAARFGHRALSAASYIPCGWSGFGWDERSWRRDGCLRVRCDDVYAATSGRTRHAAAPWAGVAAPTQGGAQPAPRPFAPFLRVPHRW